MGIGSPCDALVIKRCNLSTIITTVSLDDLKLYTFVKYQSKNLYTTFGTAFSRGFTPRVLVKVYV